MINTFRPQVHLSLSLFFTALHDTSANVSLVYSSTRITHRFLHIWGGSLSEFAVMKHRQTQVTKDRPKSPSECISLIVRHFTVVHTFVGRTFLSDCKQLLYYLPKYWQSYKVIWTNMLSRFEWRLCLTINKIVSNF